LGAWERRGAGLGGSEIDDWARGGSGGERGEEAARTMIGRVEDPLHCIGTLALCLLPPATPCLQGPHPPAAHPQSRRCASSIEVYATCARGEGALKGGRRGRKRAPLWLEWGSRGRWEILTVSAAKRTSSRNLTPREKRIGVSTYTPPVGGGWRTVRGPPRALWRCALAWNSSRAGGGGCEWGGAGAAGVTGKALAR